MVREQGGNTSSTIPTSPRGSWAAPQPGAETRLPRFSLDRGRILIVDDEPAVLNVVAKMLSSFGYQAIKATEGAGALYAFTCTPCALVISDFDMPVLNGFQLGTQIKLLHPGTRVVIMTGRDESQMSSYIRVGSMDGWLFKPFKAMDLVQMLRSLGFQPKNEAASSAG